MDHTEDMMDQGGEGWALPLRGRSAAPDGVEPAAQSQAKPAAANAKLPPLHIPVHGAYLEQYLKANVATASPFFEEAACLVGGTNCPAWDEWFQACEDADPRSIDEDRDPQSLLEWPFNPLGCERPDVCWLYRRSQSEGKS